MQSLVRARRTPLLILAVLAAAAPLAAQMPNRPAGWNPDEVLAKQEYTRPPEAIAEAVLAPRYLNVTLTEISPDRAWFLNEVGDGPVTMDRFSKPFHDLGGEFIDWAANRSRTLTIRSNAGVQLIAAMDGAVRDVRIPDGVRVSNAKWAPAGGQVAFFVHSDDATHIYVADTDGRARQLTRRPVLATLYTDFDWSEDGRTIATVLVPEDRPDMPQEPAMPTGPQVKQTEEGENMLRVFKSLMATPHDEDLLEWHATGQVALIDVESRRVTEVGAPTMVLDLDVSPEGTHVLVTRMVRPFSYVVPVRMFGSVQEIWNRSGEVMATVREDELDTGLEGGPRTGGAGFSAYGEEAGPRDVAWRSDGAGVTYLEREPEVEGAEDAATMEGDGDGRKDRLFLWSAPFGEADRTVLYESDREMSSVRFGASMDVIFVTEERRAGRGEGERVHEYVVFLDDTSETFTLAQYDGDDVRTHPGALVGVGGELPRRQRRGWSGTDGDVLLAADGASVFYAGVAYADDPMQVGPLAFIDRVDVRTGEKERVYEGDNEGVYEEPLAFVELEAGDLIVSRESRTEVSQSFRRRGGDLQQLTRNRDYTPDVTGAPTEEFVVTRPDGFKFRVTVTLPPEYREGTRLPAMFWFYPREYTDQEDYDETGYTYNKNAFPSFGTRSMEYLVRLGYAVVEPDAPIVGDEGRMNDNYEHDLRNNLAAVIDELDERGLIDRRRIGIGGHSYGAFSTLNAMVHTPFFKAGIAGDGNYNRTLTPLHFQSERRTLWEAKDTYIRMSPFLHANELTGAVLLYHGLHDQNVGTDPIHSPKLFHALNGLGKEAAMYLYPYEDHGPAAEHTLLDLWARWTAWLDKHLMADQAQAVISEDGSGS